jgi:hypothetical protein
MRFSAFLKTFPYSVAHGNKVIPMRRKCDLLAGLGVALPYRHTRVAQVSDNPFFLSVACLKKPQHATFKLLCHGMTKAIKQSTLALCPNLRRAKATGLVSLFLVLVMCENLSDCGELDMLG